MHSFEGCCCFFPEELIPWNYFCVAEIPGAPEEEERTHGGEDPRKKKKET